MSYRELTRKEITLPSGFACMVRARTRREEIEIGQPPAFFTRNARLKERGKEVPDSTPEEDQFLVKYLAAVETVILTRCVVGPLVKDGESLIIVAADPGKEQPGEISWAEITTVDKESIIEAVNELSGFGKAGQGASNTFPEPEKGTQGAS